jgi:HD-GYP domain-containing protein (c-di-GMP phosphodiesterase class II)
MRKVDLENVVLGSRLAKAVFTPDGRVLLSQGLILKESYLEKLKQSGIYELYIEDEISKGIEVNDVVKTETRIEARLLVKKVLRKYSFTDSLNAAKIEKVVDKIITDLLSSDNIVLNLSDIKSLDDYTFEHSVNVCVLSLITGISMGFNLQRLKELGVGALLHDIGKLRIPDDIVKKPSQLTFEEFEEIKKHTVYGYELLKKCKKISMVSAFIAFAHHERFDGSGYPLQIKGENIHQCARIVAISDVYDALTSDRVYRKKLKPHEVYEYVTSLGTHHFDQEIVKSFIKHIAIYPKGTGVVLNTKERGLVVQINRKIPTRPVIRVLFDEDNKALPQHYDVDLMNVRHKYVLDACEI